ncbi:hypothetical protein ACFQ9Z_18400 [Streptomyces sp. NPDC056580]|uniref:hypothetical protein n=1 Tax=Streptomyces sp. NPDC056580 TaxID=3345872 RepID=UPI003685708D
MDGVRQGEPEQRVPADAAGEQARSANATRSTRRPTPRGGHTAPPEPCCNEPVPGHWLRSTAWQAVQTRTVSVHLELPSCIVTLHSRAVADPDKAIDHTRNQCSAINGKSPTVDDVAQARFSDSTHTVDATPRRGRSMPDEERPAPSH